MCAKDLTELGSGKYGIGIFTHEYPVLFVFMKITKNAKYIVNNHLRRIFSILVSAVKVFVNIRTKFINFPFVIRDKNGLSSLLGIQESMSSCHGIEFHVSMESFQINVYI